MKKHFISTLFLAISTFYSCYAAHPQESSSVQSIDEVQQNVAQKKDWTRVTARFKREQFLVDCDNEHKTEYSKLILNNNEEQLNDICWNALFLLKDKYEEGIINYTFTYQSMASFLLTHNIFPNNCTNDHERKKFLSNLIDNIGTKIINNPAYKKHEKFKKLERWFYIHSGMLFLKYANMFATPQNKENYVTKAFREFSNAIKLKTTKTTYLLAAETILDYGHTPAKMTREEAEQLAYRYIEIAETKEARHIANRSENIQEKEKLTTVEVHARPTYIIDLNYLNPLASNNDKSSHNQPVNLIPNDFLITEDALVNYDFTQLTISHHLNIADLPLRNHPINIEGQLQEQYIIDGKTLRRQNVMGTNMRCFFNAIGLNPDGQIAQLAFFANDPIVRYMIANEIVSATANPDQIPTQVKEAINYNLYHTERNALDALENVRNALLFAQNPNEHFQNIALLAPEYQNLRQRGEEILEQLRQRALSLNAYNAFVNHHIGNEEMMVALHDVQHNGNANYTSIDAIAYLNEIGIKIFTPNEDGVLMLIHEYVPQNATEIAYIYHQGFHFQTLVPAQEEDEENHSIIAEENVDIGSERSAEIQFPNVEELQKLYPKVETCINSHYYDSNFVQRVLYVYKCLNKTYNEIATIFNISFNKVRNILIANNICKEYFFSKDVKNMMLQAYLESYKDINTKKVSKTDFAKALCIEFKKEKNIKISEKKNIQFFENFHKKQIINNFVEKKQLTKVKKLYLEGNSFFDINQKTGLNLLTIISVLDEQLDPKDYKNPMNLILNITLSEDDKSKLIIDMFQKLKKDQGIDPSITAVQKALQEYKIGYKTCQRILKSDNLVEQNIKSSHLSKDQQQQIIEDFKKINPCHGEIRRTYRTLAQKHKATFVQVEKLIKNESYKSEGKKVIQQNYDNVVNAYHKLNADQKKKPLIHLAKIIPLSKQAIRKHLIKAGLYQSNELNSPHTINGLAEHANQHKENKVSRKRKNKDNFDLEENMPVKKNKTD
jgi:hypothetical protein